MLVEGMTYSNAVMLINQLKEQKIDASIVPGGVHIAEEQSQINLIMSILSSLGDAISSEAENNHQHFPAVVDLYLLCPGDTIFLFSGQQAIVHWVHPSNAWDISELEMSYSIQGKSNPLKRCFYRDGRVKDGDNYIIRIEKPSHSIYTHIYPSFLQKQAA